MLKCIGNNDRWSLKIWIWDKGISKVTISGRSSIDNTIHIRFRSDKSESNQLVEFKNQPNIQNGPLNWKG